jgi:hypothetical protein
MSNILLRRLFSEDCFSLTRIVKGIWKDSKMPEWSSQLEYSRPIEATEQNISLDNKFVCAGSIRSPSWLPHGIKSKQTSAFAPLGERMEVHSRRQTSFTGFFHSKGIFQSFPQSIHRQNELVFIRAIAMTVLRNVLILNIL